MRVVGQLVLVGTIDGVDGYHVNAPRPLDPALAAYEVEPGPTTPVNVYAGDVYVEGQGWCDTAFLRFADEAEARAALGLTEDAHGV